MNRKFVAVAPDLHDSAGVVFCNPERACLLAQLRSGHSEGLFDDGNGGYTAEETASRIAGTGASAVSIVAGPRDQRAARILGDACTTAGLETDIEVILPPAATTPETRIIMRVPEVRTDNELREWLERCRAACREHGSDNARIAPPFLRAVPPCPGRRSPLPAGLDFRDPGWRAAFVALVAECWPRDLPPFLVALGASDLGSNPLEDAYAGLGLRERNAELLVNIVDQP